MTLTKGNPEEMGDDKSKTRWAAQFVFVTLRERSRAPQLRFRLPQLRTS